MTSNYITFLLLAPYPIIIIGIVLRILRYLSYLQQKEYRYDRLWIFLRYEGGLQEVFGFLWLFECLGLLLFLTEDFLELLFPPWILAIAIIISVFKYGIRRPRFNAKPILLFSILLLFNLSLIVPAFIHLFTRLFNTSNLPALVLSLYVFQGVIILCALFLAKPLNALLLHHKIELVKKKQNALSHLKVIGITGSYGKTSTKTFLTELLSSTFRVIATPKNVNTEIGIANFFLKKVDDSYDFFVVEMGAYKQGEIALLCDMLKPQYGILTGINSQHIGLFQGQENITKAKFELIKHLSQDGMAYVNTDAEEVRQHLEKHAFASKLFSYGLDEYKRSQTQHIRGIQKTEEDLILQKDTQQTFYKHCLQTSSALQDLIPAISMAEALGVPKTKIQDTLLHLAHPEGALRIQTLKNGIRILYDTYNSNVNGFISALDLLQKKGQGVKKLVVSAGMFDLGKYAQDEYDKVFQHLDSGGVTVLFTKRFVRRYVDHYSFVHLKGETMLATETPKKVEKWAKKHLVANSVLLLEGRIREDLLKIILRTAQTI